MRLIERIWYGRHPLGLLLTPVSLLFCALASARRAGYRRGLLRQVRLPVPVIVVGNITVGGTGKTPLVAWVAQRLSANGYRVGIVSRGYGARAETWPQPVGPGSDPRQVGDEAVLLARRTGCPMAVGPDRVAAARLLLEREAVDVLLSDDGMQHYRLGRDLEIAVVDGARRPDNGRCLPAGPLRERPVRLRQVDFVVCNGTAQAGETGMDLQAQAMRSLSDPARQVGWERFRGSPVHAVAGIGNPARFFDMLRQGGIAVIEHPFPDHHAFGPGDIDFPDDLPVLMTEKDAVKCAPFASPRHWYVPVEARLPAAFESALLERIKRLTHA